MAISAAGLMPDLAICVVQLIRRDRVRVVVIMIRWKFLEVKNALKTNDTAKGNPSFGWVYCGSDRAVIVHHLWSGR